MKMKLAALAVLVVAVAAVSAAVSTMILSSSAPSVRPIALALPETTEPAPTTSVVPLTTTTPPATAPPTTTPPTTPPTSAAPPTTPAPPNYAAANAKWFTSYGYVLTSLAQDRAAVNAANATSSQGSSGNCGNTCGGGTFRYLAKCGTLGLDAAAAAQKAPPISDPAIQAIFQEALTAYAAGGTACTQYADLIDQKGYMVANPYGSFTNDMGRGNFLMDKVTAAMTTATGLTPQ